MCGTRSRLFWLLLAVLLSLSFSVNAEKMYQISETELTALETNISELEKELKKQEELTLQLQKELSEVKSWLSSSEKARLEAESSLTTASLSFDEYERDVQKIMMQDKILGVITNIVVAGAGYLVGSVR
jgi:septal ring factor EnvC (AmiA/AmiB activator)